ncbi:response regulator transcription factor [Streptomyces sp. NPDC047706]|uniref:response regulator transcription factor n=1 Tax=Streptomyces sp. NPDC047706 TaxID=3365486 RepID=UPI00371C2C9E
MTWSTPYTGTRRPARPKAAITSRQLQILALTASGYTAAQIGARLDIAASTVHERLHRTYRKLGARDRAHAVAIALITGVLDPISIELPQTPTDSRKAS